MKKSAKNPLFIITLPGFILALTLFGIVLSACIADKKNNQQPKNLIFMIGDGMGLSQINAARLQARSEKQPFILDEFPIVGLVNTESADQLITDSAAAATAYSTGFRTINGRIAQDVHGQNLTTLLERCHTENKKTGLIATSSITHATPAAFATHVTHRSHQTEIARQLVVESQVDIILGGGLGYFLPQLQTESFRSDQHDLVLTAKEHGYEILKSKSDLLSTGKEKRKEKWLGLFAQKGFKNIASEPTLAELTEVALNKLADHKAGFCLIIEGSQIDWAAHHNDTDETMKQTRFFEEAVRKAVTFTQQDKHTLLLVTADHETGGMAITEGEQSGKNLQIHWATKHHTPIDVPLFAMGPRAEIFSGSYANTTVASRVNKLFSLRD